MRLYSTSKLLKMTPSEVYKEVIPDSDYEECKGCHNGSDRCPYVHNLHKHCPCTNCIVKTSCTDYCMSYQKSIAWESVNSDNIKVSNLNNKGYDVEITYDRINLTVNVRLWRWMKK